MGCGMPQRAKTERLEARITSRQKRLLSDAADLFGETVTQFVLRAAEERANMILHDDNLFRLAETDRVALIDALSHPPRPNKALRRSYKVYKETFG
jgi:uncharacterized protein (DUF1778 family)